MTISTIQTAYLAAEGSLEQLKRELEGIMAVHSLLVLTDRPPQRVFWARNVWLNPATIEIRSITDAANRLKEIQRNWCLYSGQLHRRAQLIQDKLPHVSAKPLVFPAPLPPSTLGSWTLLDEHTVLASTHCSSRFPNGEVNFEEDKKGPPSRAYLKLWEVLTLAQQYPHPGHFCIDAGGSPGGWAWAIHKLGARVLSVDRSPLDPGVAALPRVEFRKSDAFSLKPEDFSHVDWLFCDVICYPGKLYEWALRWVESGICDNFVCTIKFQGDPDYAIAHKFCDIPGSRVVHLCHNKHELTWMRIQGAA